MKLFFGFLLVVFVSANCPNANCNFGCNEAGTDCATTCDPNQAYFGYQICKCKTGYTGPTCAVVQKGYYANTATTVAQCACPNNEGTIAGDCNPTTGACFCKLGFTGAQCTSCASGYVNNPAGVTPGAPPCVACSVYPNCQSCQNGVCTACKASSNTINPQNGCTECQQGYASATSGGSCFIKCTEHCGAPISVVMTTIPGVPPSAVQLNPTCTYASATGVTCTACADTSADPATKCKDCKVKTYKGRKQFVDPPATAQTSDVDKCWDCNCGSGIGLSDAGSCTWQQNTRICDCKPGYTRSTKGNQINGLCEMCARGYFQDGTGAAFKCTKCPAKCDACSDANTCTKCSFGFASPPGTTSCDLCAPNFVKAGTDPTHTCTINPEASYTTIKFTPETAGPYVSSAGKATVTGEVEVTSTVDTPVDYSKLQVTSQGTSGWVVPEIKQEVAGGKATVTVVFKCDTKFCPEQSLVFVYTDSTGQSARTTQTLVLQAGSTGPAPTFVFCQPSSEMDHSRYLAMRTAGKQMTFETIASPSDPSFTLTSTVKKEINGATAVEVPATDFTTNVFGDLSYLTITPPIELGENKYTIEVKDSQTPPQTATCSFTIKTSDFNQPDLTCLDLPKFPTSDGVNFAKISMPLPICEDDNDQSCTIKDDAGTELADAAVANVYMGTHSLGRTGFDDSANEGKCQFKVTVEDKEKPTCTAGTAVTVSVPAVSGTEFRKEGNCPEVDFEIEFTATDNSLAAVPAGTTVQGTAPTGKSVTAKPALGCTCAGDVGSFKCAKQKCARTYDCNLPGDSIQEISTSVCDDADNCQTSNCHVKVTFTDKAAEGKPTVKDACDYLQANPFETDVDKATFSSSALRIGNLQQDGRVYDTAGGKVSCAVDGLEADVPVGASDRTLKCTDLRSNSAECTFKLTVVDRQIPTFGDSAAKNVCGKDLGSFDFGKGPTETWDGTKDNAALNNKPLKFNVDGDDKDEFPTSWDTGYHVVKATLTDKANNVAFCSFTFRVEGTASPSVAYKKPEIEEEKKAKTAKPTKFPTAKPAKKTTTDDSCKSRCSADGSTKILTGVMFTCSCQRDVCVKGNKPGVKCCADMDEHCANPNKCTKNKCGGSVGTGNNKCYCDLNCASKGDCCPGFNFLNTCCSGQKEPSCKGQCGKTDAQFSCSTGTSCYCDHTCQSVGDCCEDYQKQC